MIKIKKTELDKIYNAEFKISLWTAIKMRISGWDSYSIPDILITINKMIFQLYNDKTKIRIFKEIIKKSQKYIKELENKK